ncbi:hypothetical protein SAMN05192544_106845 [Paraburkholderia hospita]|jgi:hypothetical protein|nr:hypothetical protein PMI06_005615 [Burkholderia sp. BT03]SEI26302.1 hypothetical protein SAMN05192544_106845 [Paraburkholderia hospita]SKC82313.1 hypothetical protein SAMN06266956_3906 [Paraburkholderia hospita]SKC84543.1 hypothetical protein SAMN05445504_4033 [Burkholderia sp. CF099]
MKQTVSLFKDLRIGARLTFSFLTGVSQQNASAHLS